MRVAREGEAVVQVCFGLLAFDVFGVDLRVEEVERDDAIDRATPVLLEVLRRYPPFPSGRAPVAQVTSDLDKALRNR